MAHDIMLGKYVKFTVTHQFACVFLLFHLTHFPFTISVTESHTCLCVSPPLPCHHTHLISLCSSTRLLQPTPRFSLTVILSSHPSFFYSCCQISPSTPGKLHFSDYTPIKGPVSALFACCSSSLETEKCVCASVCLRVCVRACTAKTAI